MKIKLLLSIFVMFGLSSNAFAFYDLDTLNKKPVAKPKPVHVAEHIKQVKKPVAAIVAMPKPIIDKPVVVKVNKPVVIKKAAIKKAEPIYTPTPEVAAMVKKIKAEHNKKAAVKTKSIQTAKARKSVKKHYRRHYKKKVRHITHRRRYVSKASIRKIKKIRQELARL